MPTTQERIAIGTQQYYELASLQVTIHADGNCDNLSELGKNEFAEIQTRVDNGDITDVITDYYLLSTYSGSWIADKNSPFTTECVVCMNTYNNLRANGWCAVDGTRRQKITSPIVYYTDCWCYTQSGNIYLLVNPIDQVIAEKILKWVQKV